MIHICKSSTGFMVATVADNGELLSASEVLSSKQKCWNNIKSQLKQWSGIIINVQDDTLKKEIKVYCCVIGADKCFYAEENVLADTNTRYIPSAK